MNIEFVEPEFPSRRAWSGVAAIAALASLLFAAGRIMDTRAEAAVEALRLQRQAASVARIAAPRPPPAYAEDAARALDLAALPEAEGLGQVENVVVDGVALKSIDVDASGRSVTIEVEAANDKALEDYLDQLNAGLDVPVWRIVQLGSVASARAQGNGGGASDDAQGASIRRRF